MTFNQAAQVSAGARFETMAKAPASVEFLRARDFATKCWRRALRQRVQAGAQTKA